MEKKFDIKKFMSNNAIIILIALLALAVGFSTDNFFSGNNLKNLIANVSPRFIIACPPVGRSAWPPACLPCCCRAWTTLPG